MHDDRTSAAVIGSVAAFLADPEQSAFVNGHTLPVNGGSYGDASRESLKRRKQNL
jgi:NAD(P)-dependent dehydrogenase (short-subunit alcohol dehydrogenase family)